MKNPIETFPTACRSLRGRGWIRWQGSGVHELRFGLAAQCVVQAEPVVQK